MAIVRVAKDARGDLLCEWLEATGGVAKCGGLSTSLRFGRDDGSLLIRAGSLASPTTLFAPRRSGGVSRGLGADGDSEDS